MSGQVYEIEFSERGNPKGPEYRWFSSILPALDFMRGITEETHIVEMTFRAHGLDAGTEGAATFLNKIASRLTSERDDPDLPF